MTPVVNDTEHTAPTNSFGLASVKKGEALYELVRHLARISAQNDYNAFLKSLENRYSNSLEKGPPR